VALLEPWLEFAIQSQRFEFLTVSSAAALGQISLYQDPVWWVTLGVVGLLALAVSLLRLGLSAGLWVFALGLLFASSYQPVLGSHGLLLALLGSLVLLLAIGLDRVNNSKLRGSLVSIVLVTVLTSAGWFSFTNDRQFEFAQDRLVPALVMARSDVDPATRMLRIEISEQEISTELIWGDGRSQEENSLLYRYFKPQSDIEPLVAQLAGSLIAGNPAGIEELNQVLGVDFVLLQGAGEKARATRVALDSMTILQPAGETSFGQLWTFVESNNAPETQDANHSRRDIQLAILAGFALLAIPTPASITGRRVVRSK
jgi:hypothetical protein